MKSKEVLNKNIYEISQEEMYEIAGGWIGPVTNFLAGRLVWTNANVTYNRCKSSMIIGVPQTYIT